jgi:hypothetical protein
MSVTLQGAARPPAYDARGDGRPVTDSGPPPPPDTHRHVSTFRFSPLFVDESPAAKHSGQNCHASTGCARRCGQLADKKAEITPPPCVARVYSSCDDISILNARIDELARQVAALCLSHSRPHSPWQTRRHVRHSSRSVGRSPAPDICWHRRFKERAKRCTAPCTW